MRCAAFFDVDGTLVRGNIVRYYVEIKTRKLRPPQRLAWLLQFALRIPWYLLTDRLSRSYFNRRFYRNYRGMSLSELERAGETLFTEFLRPHLYQEARRRLREHRQRGHKIVLVTGSLEPLMKPLAAHLGVDRLVAAQPLSRNGLLSGELCGGALAGSRKAEAVRSLAREWDLDLGACWAYADSWDDLPMLECVGRAVAVNPPRRLERLARRRGWEVVQWRAVGGED